MKPILINLDLKINSYEDIELKQGCQDTLIATITDLGDVVDLTGQVISVEMLKGDNTFIIQSNDITVNENKVTIKLHKDFTRVKGKSKLQIKMTKSGVISGSWVVIAWVREGAIDSAIGESGNIITIKEELDKSIADAKIENDKTQDLIQNGGAATKGEIAEVRSDLAETTQQGTFEIFNTDGGNIIDIITSNLNIATTNKCKYVEFLENKQFSISPTDELEQLNNKILIGNGELISTNPNHYKKNIISSLNSFNGKVNLSKDIKNNLSQFNNSLRIGSSTVAFFGDSLSTDSPDCITYEDSYYRYVMKKFKEQYSDVTFNFVNRAIGGKVAFEGSTKPASSTGLPSWYNDYGRNWLDYIKDDAPDIIFIAFGMNEGSSLNRHLSSLKQIVATIKTWTKVPTIVFVTNPAPTYRLGNASYGTLQQQEYRFEAGAITRWYAYTEGYYVIDVNNMFSIKRDGLDLNNFKYVLKSLSWNDWVLSGSASTLDNNNLKLTGTSYVTSNLRNTNFSLKFNLVTSNTFESVVSIAFRNNVTGLYTLQIKKTGISLFYKTSLMASYSGTFDINTSYKIVVNVNNNLLSIFINDIQVLDFNKLYDTFYNEKVSIQILNNEENVILTIPRFFNSYPIQYLPKLTDDEIFGIWDGTGGTKAYTGGNGINHPSSQGWKEIYHPCIDEFISDINSIRDITFVDYYKKGAISIVFPTVSASYKLMVAQRTNGNPSALAEYNILVHGQTGTLTIAETSNTSFNASFKINSTNLITTDANRTLTIPLGTANLVDNYIRIDSPYKNSLKGILVS